MGVTEEKRDIATMPVMAATKLSQPGTPGHSSILIATPVIKPTCGNGGCTGVRSHNGSDSRAHSQNGGDNNAPLCHCCHSCVVKLQLCFLNQVKSELLFLCQVTAVVPESSKVKAVSPESSQVAAVVPELSQVSDLHESRSPRVPSRPVCCTQIIEVSPLVSRLVSSLRDAPLVSACSAGIPKPTHLNPVAELFPPSVALSIAGIALWCVWATYTNTESLEVAACAAEPPEAAVSAVASSEAVMPAAVSLEVAAYAAEPHEMRMSASALCTVVAPSNTPSTRELSSWSKPAKEATYELSSCPNSAMEAACDLSACPITAKEAITELSAHPVTSMEAAYEHFSCSESALKSDYELSVLP
ncbi:hypothetical protein M9458_051855, partial [Cirrhinus mrigala]